MLATGTKHVGYCGECLGCATTDCGDGINCKGMKLGGPGQKKECCIQWKCMKQRRTYTWQCNTFAVMLYSSFLQLIGNLNKTTPIPQEANPSSEVLIPGIATLIEELRTTPSWPTYYWICLLWRHEEIPHSLVCTDCTCTNYKYLNLEVETTIVCLPNRFWTESTLLPVSMG